MSLHRIRSETRLPVLGVRHRAASPALPRIWGASGCWTFGEELFEFLARLEVRHSLRRNIDRLAGFGIAAAARTALPGTEASEPAQLDLLALVQCADNRVKDGFDYHFGIALVQLRR